MTNLLKPILSPLACGLMLSGAAFSQVVEDVEGRSDDLNVVRRVSEILGGEARGPGDEGRIAAISDMIMDGQGAPHYVLLSRGGVAGVGGETIAVPFGVGQLVYVENGGWRLVLEITGEQLEQAPTLEEGSLDQLRDANWIQANRQFFGADEAGADEGTGDDSFLFRASALNGAQVRGVGGEDSIANVDEVLIGSDFRATHAILGYGGVAGLGKDQVPVPFSMLSLSAEQEDDRYVLIVAVDTTKERLQSDVAPKLDGEYNRMLDPTFLDRIEEYFAARGEAGAVEPAPRR
jgi:hypothetical protein